MFQFVKEKFGSIHVLVNNAGLAHFAASLLAGKTELWKDMLDVNVLALSICTREAIQLMKASNVDNGHIFNISSVAGHVISSMAPFYSCTKFAVKALTEGLRQELRAVESHIRVTSISPGAVLTDFGFRPYVFSLRNLNPRYNSSTFPIHVDMLKSDDIADTVVFALQAPPHVDVNEIIVRPTEGDV
uniref:Dehydrogenase/reductase SDR family member 11 n=1 Tax=Ciona savignyi TaxID=51511 RepID=H2YGD0_CIOSA